MSSQSLNVEVCLVRLPMLRQNLVLDAGVLRHTAASEAVIKLLNVVLAEKLATSLCYRSHYFLARAIHLSIAATKFLSQANAELHHADLLAERILQLGGMPDFSMPRITRTSETGYSLASMVRDDLIAADIAIGSYHGLIASLGDFDSTTRHMMEDMIAIKEHHADELSELLVARYREDPQMIEKQSTAASIFSPPLDMLLQTG